MIFLNVCPATRERKLTLTTTGQGDGADVASIHVNAAFQANSNGNKDGDGGDGGDDVDDKGGEMWGVSRAKNWKVKRKTKKSAKRRGPRAKTGQVRTFSAPNTREVAAPAGVYGAAVYEIPGTGGSMSGAAIAGRQRERERSRAAKAARAQRTLTELLVGYGVWVWGQLQRRGVRATVSLVSRSYLLILCFVLFHSALPYPTLLCSTRHPLITDTNIQLNRGGDEAAAAVHGRVAVVPSNASDVFKAFLRSNPDPNERKDSGTGAARVAKGPLAAAVSGKGTSAPSAPASTSASSAKKRTGKKKKKRRDDGHTISKAKLRSMKQRSAEDRDTIRALGKKLLEDHYNRNASGFVF